ncbi:multiprotein bridging factor type 1, putative [Eimeria acervulina]|uniref:Multiprotein bridging factor type 1, putative n=1 Tax=Eimeria acervulina TaxID=5801 RepID=U6GAD9_EIMAC|nr:multiprotein bridging factor type 1, putative [Eimeria acervulina]CDI77241.1 multiprotein bridging factor type 1, putative [Eimeria acervulina]
MSGNFQDWTPVTLQKTSPGGRRVAKEQEINKARRAGDAVETEKKFLGGQNRTTKANLIPNAKKVEEDTGDYHIDRVSTDFSRALAEARRNKGMTQAQLAQAINEKPSVVSEYESGKAIPNGVILQKMSRALGVQLPKCKQKKRVADE